MKIWRGFPLWGWLLVSLLVMAAAFLTLTRDESESTPSASSYGPSGAKAFADLLRLNGYRVSVVRQAEPDLPKEAVAVMFFGSLPDVFSIVQMKSVPQNRTIEHVLREHPALMLNLGRDFQEDSKLALATPTQAVTAWNQQVTLRLSASGGLPTQFGDYSAPDDQVPLASVQSTPIAGLSMNRGHYIANIRDGIIATNRFIGREDDAAFLLAVMARITPPGANVVFVDSSYEPGSEPGLMELIGSWALAAWWQILVLFIVVCYTLGKPFGFAEPERIAQRGTRELVDGLAGITRRGKAYSLILKTLAHDADREIRQRLKLPRDATVRERNARIPEGLARILTEAESGEAKKTKDVVRIAKELGMHLTAFLQSREGRNVEIAEKV